MSNRTRWLNRTLVLGPHLCLCTSEPDFERVAKRLGWRGDGYLNPWVSGSNAACTHMDISSTTPTAVVCIPSIADMDDVYAAGIIAQESANIWSEWIACMGETAPGEEISAHAIQNLVVILMSELDRQRKSMPHDPR